MIRTYFPSLSAGIWIMYALCLLVPEVSSGQCTFTITRNNADTHCLFAVEDVVWRNAANVTIAGNNITKNNSSASWDAGALSVNRVGNNGWATMVVNEVNTERMFGISSQATVSVTPGFNRSQFGIMLRNNLAPQRIAIYESGNFRVTPLGAYGDYTYRNGDVFRIWIDKGVVKYYQNNTLLYISSLIPNTPMVVDATLGTWTPTFASIRQVKVGNGSNGSFVASASNGGGNPTYQWYVDGSPVGTGTTYTDTGLKPPSTLRCILTTDATGCPANSIVSSNWITFEEIPLNTFADYNTLNNGTEYACLAATEPAVFTDQVSIEAVGNSVTKNRGLTGWNAGAFSINSIVNNGYVEAVVPQTNKGIYFGLSKTNPDFNAGKFAFFIRSDATLEIYESNVLVTSLTGTYGLNTRLKIEIDNNVVKYYTNNTLRYISSVKTVPADFPLHIDLAFNDLDGSLNSITASNGTSGSFSTRITSVGSSPQYQWKRNGTDIIGATSSSFVFPVVDDHNVITCAINPDLIGCTTVITPDVGLSQIPFKGTLYVSNEISPIACAETEENVTFTDLSNVTAPDNDIVKFQGGNGIWNAGATSLNLIENNGYAKVVVNQTNTAKVFGLSSSARVLTHSSSANSFIQYGINFRADSRFEVYEYDGTFYTRKTLDVPFGSTDDTFVSGEVFKIKVDNGIVRYYRNSGSGDQLFYTSAMTPSLPLVVDISLNTQTVTDQARFDDVVVSNGSSGIFKANTSNMGPSPTYQWRWRGTPDGANASTYSNSDLLEGDKVTCTITPGIPGCNTGYLSNIVEVKKIGGATSPTTTWNGNSSPSWSNPANWSNGVPNGYTKVVIPSGMLNNPLVNVANSGVYDLTINSGASLTIDGTNSLYVFDTWSNAGIFSANTSTVRFKTCTNNKNTILSVSPERFNNLVTDNLNGINVTGQHNVKTQMNLISGIVDYGGPSDLIIFDDNATVTGASSIAYINGKVRKIGNDAFSFPIGKSGTFAPASISAPIFVTDLFDAEYMPSTPPSNLKTASTIKSISDCEYWAITGTAPVNITLSWRTCLHYVISDKNHMLVARLSTDVNGDPIWANDGNSGSTGGAGGGTVTSTGASLGDYYTLGSMNLATTLPIELVSFDGLATREGNILRWVTASETTNERFEIECSMKPGDSFQKIGEVTGMGTSTVRKEYSFVHQKPQHYTYYRLRQVDFDQTFEYSKIIGLENNFERVDSFEIYPVPVTGSNIYFNIQADVVVINQMGQILMEQRQVNFLDVSGLKSGIYFIKTASGVTRKFVK